MASFQLLSYCNYPVGALVAILVFSPYIGLLIIPSDDLIFFRGVAKKHQPVIQLCFRSVNDDSSRHPTLFSVLPRAPLRFGSIAKVPSSQVPVLFSDYCLYMHTQYIYIYIYVYIHIQLSLALYHLCSMSASVET